MSESPAVEHATLTEWLYARYPHAFMSYEAVDEIVQYDPGYGLMFPPGTACRACSATKTLVRDHCHEHGWVRSVVCGSCNRYLGHIDRRIMPQVDEDRVTALLAVRNHCPDCEPISVFDLASPV